MLNFMPKVNARHFTVTSTKLGMGHIIQFCFCTAKMMNFSCMLAFRTTQHILYFFFRNRLLYKHNSCFSESLNMRKMLHYKCKPQLYVAAQNFEPWPLYWHFILPRLPHDHHLKNCSVIFYYLLFHFHHLRHSFMESKQLW